MKATIGIIVDTDIIRDSPDILLLSGVGDLISNLSAVKDCRLAEKEINERVDKFAVSIAQLGANGLLAFQKEDLKSSQFIEQLANGLIVSGMAMVIANSSRPASGAEHLISHAIDEFFPAKSTLHGLQVAWAHLLLEKLVRKDNSDYEVLYAYFEKIGLIDAFKFNIDFTEDDFYSLIPLAINMRNRFTVLNLFNQSNV